MRGANYRPITRTIRGRLLAATAAARVRESGPSERKSEKRQIRNTNARTRRKEKGRVMRVREKGKRGEKTGMCAII